MHRNVCTEIHVLKTQMPHYNMKGQGPKCAGMKMFQWKAQNPLSWQAVRSRQDSLKSPSGV